MNFQNGEDYSQNPFARFTDDSENCLQHTLHLLIKCHLQDEILLTLARQTASKLLADVSPALRKPRIAKTVR